MNDPRDKRFSALKKKDISQLTDEDIRELIGYCDKMLSNKLANKNRRSWSKYRTELQELIDG